MREKGGGTDVNLKFLAPTYHARVKAVLGLVRGGERLADIGCSAGEIGGLLAPRFKAVVGVDLCKPDIACGQRLKAGNQCLLVGDVTRLPLQPRSFDVALCLETLEHVPGDESVLAEIYGLLRPGGQLIVSVPHQRFPFTYDPVNALLGVFGLHLPIGMWGFGHLRLYSEEELWNKLAVAGFVVEKRKRLTRFLAGLCENYLSSLFQFLVKPDASNQGRGGGTAFIRPKAIPDNFLVRWVGRLVALDEALFRNSKTSVGLLVEARKP